MKWSPNLISWLRFDKSITDDFIGTNSWTLRPSVSTYVEITDSGPRRARLSGRRMHVCI